MIKRGKESPVEIREQLKRLTDTSESKNMVISIAGIRKKVLHRARSPNVFSRNSCHKFRFAGMDIQILPVINKIKRMCF
jgi:hypothetical protein